MYFIYCYNEYMVIIVMYFMQFYFYLFISTGYVLYLID